MLKVYGSMLCKDCVQCRKALDKLGVEYVYLDFADSLQNLKDFLKLREDPAFDEIKKHGGIGIPCIQREDGSFGFRWQEFVQK